MTKGYAVVRLSPNVWEITSYFFGKGAYARALKQATADNRVYGRKECGVFAAVSTSTRCGLWFEAEEGA